MISKPDRPYLEKWLRRTRRQLAVSGRLSEIALILSREEGLTPAVWSLFLREMLEERMVPPPELLTRIDALLARPLHHAAAESQPCLF